MKQSQPLAVEEAIRVMKTGGNAADACLAMAAILAVTEPFSNGVGGDAFCLYYHRQTGKVYSINGSGRSPQALTREHCVQNTVDRERSVEDYSVNSVIYKTDSQMDPDCTMLPTYSSSFFIIDN